MMNKKKLFRQINGNIVSWNSGAAFYWYNYEYNYSRLLIAVKCRLGNMEETELALLDTGAEWSVIGDETAEIIKDQLSLPTGDIKISTRFGVFQGTLYRLNISLLADPDCGSDLTVESTVLIVPQWTGPIAQELLKQPGVCNAISSKALRTENGL